ncbi:DUF3006 domain-containing protein [Candidatus Uhrbacteria bacterium]|nr:DUF3006 domain-containing protein [Candidatus Uhrbacteria bacterium]
MRCTIDRLETDVAVLRNDDGQELAVPIAELPDGVGEGDVLEVRFGQDVEATDDRAARARDVLNEILGSESTDAPA